jgi:hypothetical protein
MTFRELCRCSNKNFRTRRIIFLVSTYTFIILACAKVLHPEGGPKDLTPPKLVSTFPTHGSTLFTGKSIILYFDKEVDVNGLYGKLKISPSLKVGDSRGYTYKARGNTIEIELEQPLKANKTYTFNFNDAIVDTTEGNVAENIVLTFSTGTEIDMMHISGNVLDLLTATPISHAYVLLYNCNNELDEHKILTGDEPDYFTKTDENGCFAIQHISPGKYRVYSYYNTTGVLKYIPGEGKLGTLHYIVDLESESADSINIKITDADYSEFRIIKIIPRGHHCEIQFNKPIVSYELDSELMSILSQNKKSIHIYNPNNETEKDIKNKILNTKIRANDINGNEIEESIEIVLNSFNTNYLESSFTVKPTPDSMLSSNIELKIVSNKPIETINPDGITLHLSDKTILLTSDNISLSNNQDEIRINYDISNEILNYEEMLSLVLRLDARAIVDIDNNGNAERSYAYKIKNPKKHGSISGSIYTSTIENTGYLVQLLKLDGTIESEIPSTMVQDNKYKFMLVPRGKYLVRILTFSENKSYWSPGNIFKNVLPDRVEIYPGLVEVLENWDITDINFY